VFGTEPAKARSQFGMGRIMAGAGTTEQQQGLDHRRPVTHRRAVRNARSIAKRRMTGLKQQT
jgi:hypothetical protein